MADLNIPIKPTGNFKSSKSQFSTSDSVGFLEVNKNIYMYINADMVLWLGSFGASTFRIYGQWRFVEAEICFCCPPHGMWCIHPPPTTLPTPTTTTSTTKPPVPPFLLFFGYFCFEKFATDSRSSRESRFDARKQRRFVRWSSPSTRSVAGGWWWSSLVTPLLVTVERWGYRNHMGQWDWFLKIYSIWYITVLEDCNCQLTCYKSGRQICMYINIYIYNMHLLCTLVARTMIFLEHCDIFGFTGQKRTNKNLFVCSVWVLSWSLDSLLILEADFSSKIG